jgi:hypothetical protein
MMYWSGKKVGVSSVDDHVLGNVSTVDENISSVRGVSHDEIWLDMGRRGGIIGTLCNQASAARVNYSMRVSACSFCRRLRK